MTDALAALGVMALVASGQFSRGVNIAVMIALVLAISMKEVWRQEASNKHADTISVFALVVVQVARALFTGASVLDLLIEFAVGLQIIRVATRKGAAHDQQVIVLALLHLIAGTVVGGGLGYGLCFFGLLVVTPGALVLSHLRREVEGNYRQGARDRTGLPVDVPRILRSKRVVGRQFIAVTCLLSVPILLFTVSLFVVFPRVGLSLLLLNRPKSPRMIGFSGRVDLGQIGTLRSDPTIALRVVIPGIGSTPPQRKVMHLRGTALDYYDGRSWSQSNKQSRVVANGGDLVPVSAPPEPGTDPEWRIELEPIDPPVLFLPPDAKGLRLRRGPTIGPGTTMSVQRGPEGEFRYQAPNDRGVHYEVYIDPDGAPSFGQLRSSERKRYLQLPSDMPERIGELARTWSDGQGDDMARARAIERHLRTEYTYDLSSPSGAYDQPLDHFLFESRRGHCEYYSTAMAVMLRTVGIPSRNVTGFIGGTWNKFGEFYAVRQGDAHSWVEAYVEGRGWLTFDPTPPGAAEPQSDVDGMLAQLRDFFEAVSQRWNRHVLGYDLRQQVSLFESLSDRHRGAVDMVKKPGSKWLLVMLGAMLALGSIWWLLRRRRRALQADGPGARQRTKDEALATNLYQLLDRVMAAMGIARGAAMPPLRHATGLAKNGHPASSEIVSLTERYLEARFGDQPFTGSERRAYEARVRRLKDVRKGVEPPPLELVDEPSGDHVHDDAPTSGDYPSQGGSDAAE
jgi:protein-glutamine gamma-glutamyltransferase